MRGFVLRVLLCTLLLVLSVQAEMIAVIDKTQRPVEGLRDQLLDYAVDAVRTRARDCLSADYNVLTRETTLAILTDNEIDPSACVGRCELEMARALAADYLVSTQFILIAGRIHLQMILFRTVDGLLMGSEELVAADESQLVELLPEYTAMLYARIEAPVIQTPANRRTRIDIFSEPAGAAVYVDQGYYGTTPNSLELGSGLHEFKLSLAGYEDMQERILLSRDTTLSINLLPAFATVSILSDPADQPVRVDAQLLGRTPLLRQILAPGQHHLSVGDVDLYYPRELTLFLDRGEHRDCQLDPMPRAGACELNVSGPDGPLSASIFLDGKEVGTTPFRGQLPVGRHELRVLGRREQVQVREGKPLSLHWELEHDDGVKATISSTPQGARVYLEGEYVGRTPVEATHLPGACKLRLSAQNHTPIEREIQWHTGGQFAYRLKARTSTISVRVLNTESSFRVSIDGHEVGSTPWEGELSIGDHQLRVGHYSRQIKVEADSRRDLVLQERQVLPPAAKRSGWFFGVGTPLPQWQNADAVDWHRDENADDDDGADVYRLCVQVGMLWQSPRWHWELGYAHYRMKYESALPEAVELEYPWYNLSWGAVEASLLYRLPLSRKDSFLRDGWQLGLGGGVSQPVHSMLKVDDERTDLELRRELFFWQGMLGYYNADGVNFEFGYRLFNRKIESVPLSEFKPNCWFLRISYSN